MKDLRGFLAEKVERNRDKPYLYFQDRAFTYGEVDRQCNRVANAMLALGVKKGDHVALVLPNCPEWVFSWLGLAKIGAITVAVNPQLKADGLAYALQQSDASLAIVHQEALDEYDKAAPSLPNTTLVPFGLPSPQVACGNGRAEPTLAEMLAGAPTDEPPDAGLSGKDDFIIGFTSGTTGRPKAVLNPHWAFIAAAVELARVTELAPDDRIYVSLPLHHANPQVYGVLTALSADASIAVASRFSASGFWDDVRRVGATAFTYVGAVLPILLAQPEKPCDADHPVRKCFGGGAPKDVSERMKRRFGVEVLELYGMSETGTWNCINRPGRVRPGTTGELREGFDMRIFDDNDDELPVGSVGEIVVRPSRPFLMFSGYYKMPEETLASHANLWFHTGDLGSLDAQGYYSFCGRKKESIRRGGENITPYEIEKVVCAVPAVAEAAAVGVPDVILGEEIKLYVVCKTGQSISPGEIIAVCEEQLPKFMVPRYVEFIGQLPKTPSEKVEKGVLKARGVGQCWTRV